MKRLRQLMVGATLRSTNARELPFAWFISPAIGCGNSAGGYANSL
jgi:hypothetical protein